LVLLLGSLIVGCDDLSFDDDAVQGSGNVITESRSVSGFDEIVVLGSGTVRVEVTGTESLIIEAEDNIMPLLTTDVRNGRLELGSESGFSTTRGIVYTITVESLEAIEINGSGDVTANGVDAEGFDVEINGSGEVEVAGTSNELSVRISGSGDYRGAALVAATGSVKVSGSGEALVNVTGILDVDVSGSGDVEYLGDPTVTQNISGSGSVSRR
jgi:hypothetical protein